MDDPPLPMRASKQQLVESENGSLSMDALPLVARMCVDATLRASMRPYWTRIAKHVMPQDPPRRMCGSRRPQRGPFHGLDWTCAMVPHLHDASTTDCFHPS